jgi:hypothetical protein
VRDYVSSDTRGQQCTLGGSKHIPYVKVSLGVMYLRESTDTDINCEVLVLLCSRAIRAI